MERRQEQYSEDKTPKMTRAKRNASLYEEINSNIGYGEVKDFENEKVIDLSSLNVENPKREDYQAVKDYKEILSKEEEIEETPETVKEEPKKEFDINAVLEEAKKNRKADEEKEKKRKLDGEENVLTSLNRKYLHSKEFNEEDSEDLKELINTITSKTLAQDIKDEEEKELLSDLLATTIDIKLEQELSNDDINKLYDKDEKSDKDDDDDEIQIDENTSKKIENSFFTHSVEISKDDLDLDKDDIEDEEFDNIDNKGGVVKIVLISIVLLALLLIIIYFVLKIFGISII